MGAPQFGGVVNEGHVKETDDAEHGAKTSALYGVFAVVAQHEVGHKDEPEHQGEGELRIPNPPGTPDGFGPYGTGEEY